MEQGYDFMYHTATIPTYAGQYKHFQLLHSLKSMICQVFEMNTKITSATLKNEAMSLRYTE